MKIRTQRIVVAFGVIVLTVGGYIGWQTYTGQLMAPSTSQPNSITPVSPSATPASGNYKQSMSKTYQQTLQEMQNLKKNTLALQDGTISLSSYKASIVQSQSALSAAEAFVRANPPTDTKLDASYQEFLGGIGLAKQALDVVLHGVSSFSPSEFYRARDMGKSAQQQVVKGYSNL